MPKRPRGASIVLHSQWLYQGDLCREDAHRAMMCCYVRLGERAAALHHYRICQDILGAEFDMVPEQQTTALFELIRLHPEQI
jgi:DNA-binding SARP family transcriptional activator